MKQSWQKRIINGIKCLVPFDIPTEKHLDNYKENEVLTGPVAGTRKTRSLQQLKRYWWMCRKVSENAQDRRLSTMELVDWHIRHDLKFYELDKIHVTPSGDVQFFVRSISFKNLKHIDACDYFNRADECMAEMLGCTVDEFDSMWGR